MWIFCRRILHSCLYYAVESCICGFILPSNCNTHAYTHLAVVVVVVLVAVHVCAKVVVGSRRLSRTGACMPCGAFAVCLYQSLSRSTLVPTSTYVPHVLPYFRTHVVLLYLLPYFLFGWYFLAVHTCVLMYFPTHLYLYLSLCFNIIYCNDTQ